MVKEKEPSVQIIKHNFDSTVFDKSVEYWIERFNTWHKEIGRGFYNISNVDGSGYCPLKTSIHAESGMILSGDWADAMQDPLIKKILEHYPTERYGIFIVDNFITRERITYYLELQPNLPSDLEIERTWVNSSEFLAFIESRKREIAKMKEKKKKKSFR